MYLGNLILYVQYSCTCLSVDACEYVIRCPQRVPTEHCGACLEELCRVVWRILLNFCLIHHWHERDSATAAASSAAASSGSSSSSSSATSGATVLLRRLSLGRQRLWADVQLRVRLFLQSVQLSQLALDQFFAVLEIIDRCSALLIALYLYSPYRTRTVQ